MSKKSNKKHFSLEDKIDILQNQTQIMHHHIFDLAKILDEYTFQQLRDLAKAIRHISQGTNF